MDTTQELRTLLHDAAAGDVDAFASYYDRTIAQVFGLARLLTRDVGEAGLLCRRVYRRAWDEAPRYDGSCAPLTWLLAITRDVARDRAAAA